MRRIQLTLFISCLVFASVGYSNAQPASVYQISTITALKEGLYEGHTSFLELKQHGDFGIGTVNGLDGEMIALDGEFFQIRADGKAYPIPDYARTPFAVVTFFRPEAQCSLSNLPSFSRLQEHLDGLIQRKDKLSVIRIEGRFKHLKVRSIAGQNKPYPKLEEALETQAVFALNGVRGALVGFRFPSYMEGVNVGGYHFHFITHDKKEGGHVLECNLEAAELRLAVISAFELRLISEDGINTVTGE